MTELTPNICKAKNQWLAQQVDVEYPTKESIEGRKIYLESVESAECFKIDPTQLPSGSYADDEIFLVDFHRLTVMFALLQSQRWQSKSEQELIVEFLTQIIYSEPCQLYIGFKNGEPSAAAMVTETGGELLISDIIVAANNSESEKRQFAASVIAKLPSDTDQFEAVYLEI
ncbi:flavodoxin [Vibrio japonicus]|uniref:Flavodoxin n=1 Tax=Vibrio japonicus TaxID=1824638 RepID=A0ABY5LNQ8_9VIBR|nr:flavodoxin [Vibrio japonicus]UUM32526.1 flavodoxin [Vibrio japonicus]